MRKIHIIISNIEQVTEEIKNNPKVSIVLHSQMMPAKVLPTFNSTTIEMYLRRIPDLAEHFIYGNDDMFPVSELKPEDFFSDDGNKIKLQFRVSDKLTNQFKRVCSNNNKTLLKDLLLKTDLKPGEYYKPIHSITPMIKSHCSLIVEKCGKDIFPYVDAFRTDRQHNQYIYPVYEKLTKNCLDSTVNFKYMSYSNTLDSIVSEILNSNTQVICINDTPGTYRQQILENKDKIIDAFKLRLSGTTITPSDNTILKEDIAENIHPNIVFGIIS
ncbi:MAG: hypothetical protein J6W64_00950 [Bacilli bacterium]|nr:hypothetical protein [Bacilli bacterium]